MGLSAREQHKQGCCVRENEPGAEGDRASPHCQGTIPQHLSRTMVATGPSTRCHGGPGLGLVSRLQSGDKVGLGCIQGGRSVPRQQGTGLGSGTPTT